MKHQIAVTVLVVMVVLGSGCIALAGSENQGLTKLDMSEGQVTMEVVGQVTNTPADATHPMGSSMQYGYVSHLNGFANVFSSNNAADQNESTAQLTFYTEVTTKSVTVNGPFSIIIREGTTTIYLNSGAANFSSPNSFRSGTPIQTSTIRQQVIVDAPQKTFTVVNVNTVTTASRFTLGGQQCQLAEPGQMFRTHLQGVLFTRSGGTPPPTGHFAGYGIGAAQKKS